jgi:hypothetical protein
MKIKTTERYCYTPVGRAEIKYTMMTSTGKDTHSTRDLHIGVSTAQWFHPGKVW